MVRKIVGKSVVDYVSKKTNQRVFGIILYCTYEERHTEGVAAERVYISSRSDFYPDIQSAPVGAEVEFYYNRWGNLDFVKVL